MIIRHHFAKLLLTGFIVISFCGLFKECLSQEGFDQPLILVHPSARNVVVTIGNESANLQCLAIGDNLTYRWEKENATLSNKAIGQNSHNLTLPDLRVADSGNYRCRVSNPSGTVLSNFAYVNVSEFLQATVEPNNQTIEVTTSSKLSCTVDGFALDNVSYVWEVREESSSPPRLLNTTSPILLLSNVTTSLMYQCIVTNARGTSAKSTFSYLSVVVHPPRITTHPTSKNMELNNSNSNLNFSFTCAGNGNFSHYQWERLQGALPANSQGSTANTMTIYNIQPVDGGHYRCSISNNSGTAYSNYAMLNITVRPPIIVEVYANQQLYHSRDEAMLVCRGEGYGRLQFRWKRQTGNISEAAIVDTNNGTLLIPELLSSDEGNYRCMVYDDWNNTVYSEYIHLNVSERPLEINAAPETILARQNSNVSFTCSVADRLINTTFLWSRSDGKTLSERVHGVESNVLNIIGVREEDEGTYICTTTSGQQMAVTNVSLTVYGIPVIQPLRPQYTAEVAGALWLSCSAENDVDSPHPLEITWSKGDVQLTDGMGGRFRITSIRALSNVIIATLMISNVERDDAGQYGCHVQPGDIITETTLIVHYEPEITTFQILPSNNVMLGDSIQILCRVDAEPLPSITMYRNNVTVFTTARRIVDYQIQRVSIEDDGTVFSCAAENSVGRAEQHITLTVTGLPDVTPSTTVGTNTPMPSAMSSVASSTTATSILVTPTPQPTTVASINVEQISRGLTSVQIQWTASHEMTDMFRVQFFCSSPCAEDVMNFTTTDTSIAIYGLQPDHNYTAQVAAMTSDGAVGSYSDPVQLSTVTRRAASVKQVMVENRKLREATVQWRIDEDISQDLLFYQLQQQSGQDAIIVNSDTLTLAVPAEESSVVITAVYRLNGSDVTWSSAPVTATLPAFVSNPDNSLLFQLRLVSDVACDDWKTQLNEITSAIVVALTEHCACPLSAMDVFSDSVTCDSTGGVLYRAGLGVSSRLDTEQIGTIVNEWITQVGVLSVAGSTLQVDHSCPVLVSSLNEPICSGTTASPPTSSNSGNSIIPLVAGVIAGVIIGAVLIAILIVILVIKYRGKTDKIRPGGNSPMNGSLEMTQMRSTRRKAQNDEENNTYSEVFNNLPPCPIQPCPAYQSSAELEHDYAMIEGDNHTIHRHSSSAHVFSKSSAQPVPAQSDRISSQSAHIHNELQLSMSSSSSGKSSSNDYSEPLTLSERLDSKASRNMRLSPAQAPAGYTEPITHRTASNVSRLDSQDAVQQHDYVNSVHRPQAVPSEYLEPVIRNQSQGTTAALQSRQQSGQRPSVNLYTELIKDNN